MKKRKLPGFTPDRDVYVHAWFPAQGGVPITVFDWHGGFAPVVLEHAPVGVNVPCGITVELPDGRRRQVVRRRDVERVEEKYE